MAISYQEYLNKRNAGTDLRGNDTQQALSALLAQLNTILDRLARVPNPSPAERMLMAGLFHTRAALTKLSAPDVPQEKEYRVCANVLQGLHDFLRKSDPATGKSYYDLAAGLSGVDSNALANGLNAVDGVMNLGLAPLQEELAADRQNPRPPVEQPVEDINAIEPPALRTLEELRTLSDLSRNNATTHVDSQAANRDALQNLNALYTRLRSHDRSLPKSMQLFSSLTGSLQTLRDAIAAPDDGAPVVAQARLLLSDGTLTEQLRKAHTLLSQPGLFPNEALRREMLEQLQRSAVSLGISNELIPVPEQIRAQVVQREDQLKQAEQNAIIRDRHVEWTGFRRDAEIARSLATTRNTVRNASADRPNALGKASLEERKNVYAAYLALRHTAEATGDRTLVNQTLETAEQHYTALRDLPAFRSFVAEREPEIRAAVLGKPNALRDLFREHLAAQKELPTETPPAYAPTMLNRTERLMEKIQAESFSQLSPADKLYLFSELFAARMTAAGDVPGVSDLSAVVRDKRVDVKDNAVAGRYLRENPDFQAFVRDHERELRASLRGRTHGGAAEELFRRYVSSLPAIHTDIPDRYQPTALQRTEQLVQKLRGRMNGANRLDDDAAVQLLAELFGARANCGAKVNSTSELSEHLAPFASNYSRDLQNNQDFRYFVHNNRPALERALAGKTHGGKLEALYRKHIREMGVIPDNVPERYMPTALERIDAMKETVSQTAFLGMEEDVQREAIEEILAARIAADAPRNKKSALAAAGLDAEKLRDARDSLRADGTVTRLMQKHSIREIKAAIDSGHGGALEDLLIQDLKDVEALSPTLPQRYQPTAQERSAFLLQRLKTEQDPQKREALAAELLVLHSFCRDNMNERLNDPARPTEKLLAQADALKNSQLFREMIQHGALPNAAVLAQAKDPLATLRYGFQSVATRMELNHAQRKELPYFARPTVNSEIRTLKEMLANPKLRLRQANVQPGQIPTDLRTMLQISVLEKLAEHDNGSVPLESAVYRIANGQVSGFGMVKDTVEQMAKDYMNVSAFRQFLDSPASILRLQNYGKRPEDYEIGSTLSDDATTQRVKLHLQPIMLHEAAPFNPNAEPTVNPEQRFAEIKQTLAAHSGEDGQVWRNNHAKQIARCVAETVCLKLANDKNNPELLKQSRVKDDTQKLMETRGFQIMLTGKKPEELMQIIQNSNSLNQAAGNVTQTVNAATDQYVAQRANQRLPEYGVQQQVQPQVQGPGPVLQQNP